MFLRFDEKPAYDEEGNLVNACDLNGFSGGAILDLGDFTLERAYASGVTHRSSLSGMLIEHNRKHEVMVAVKIGLILEGIKRALEGSQPSK